MSSTITKLVGTQPLFASVRAHGSALGRVLASHRPLFEALAIYIAAALAIDAAVPEASILHLHLYDGVFALMVQVYVIGFLAMFALPPFIQELVAAGELLNYIAKRKKGT